jgi:two-component system OmpR family response regulator
MGADARQSQLLNLDKAISVLLFDNNYFSSLLLSNFLVQSGMVIKTAATVAEGFVTLQDFTPDVILLGSDLADCERLALVKCFSEHAECGIVVFSAAADAMECVIDLELGADEFISREISMREIIARIRAVARRVGAYQNAILPVREQAYYQIGKLLINLKQRAVKLDSGRTVDLSETEFLALQTLVVAKGQSVFRERLSEACFKRSDEDYKRVVDRVMSGLRRKVFAWDNQIVISSSKRAGYAIVVKSSQINAHTKIHAY